MVWDKLKPKSSRCQDGKPNIFSQVCVYQALGAWHWVFYFPLSCSRRKRGEVRDQSVNTPKAGNRQMTHYSNLTLHPASLCR